MPAGAAAVARVAPAASKAIEDVAIFDRLAGSNPALSDAERALPEPDPATWRVLRLRMTEEGGGRLRIRLARPLTWIELAGAEPGGWISLDLPEMGAVGRAEVLAIDACPPLWPGRGNVVTGTFTHEAGANLVTVRFSGGIEPIGVTDNHPFWSEDRRDFIPVGRLRHGERVRTKTGTAEVIAVAKRPGEMVYNLEVHGEHVYEVSSMGVLVHNSCAGFNPAMRQAQDWLKARGFDPSKATPFASRMSERFGGGRINGMRHDNVGYRIEFDARSGAHINVFAGKEIGPHFTFSQNEADMLASLRQLFGN